MGALGASVGGGLGSGVGSVIGDLFSGGNQDEIRKILERLNAEAGPSAFESVKEDPAMRGEQIDTIGALRDIANKGGMRTQDKVAMREGIDASNANEAANRGAILQSMSARGMGGSGSELAAQLANEQGSATRAAQAGSTAAAAASARALQAISQRGQMAGQVRTQDYGVQRDRAGAQDAMSQFNAGQRVQKAGMQTGVEQQEIDRKRRLGGGIGGMAGAGAGAVSPW